MANQNEIITKILKGIGIGLWFVIKMIGGGLLALLALFAVIGIIAAVLGLMVLMGQVVIWWGFWGILIDLFIFGFMFWFGDYMGW